MFADIPVTNLSIFALERIALQMWTHDVYCSNVKWILKALVQLHNFSLITLAPWRWVSVKHIYNRKGEKNDILSAIVDLVVLSIITETYT